MQDFSFAIFTGLVIKIYALMTPTAVLSYYIAHTDKANKNERLIIACKTGAAIFLIGEILFLFGAKIFTFFGFTMDAFKIGVGILLFLQAIRLMNGQYAAPAPREGAEISVVPLATPLGMGPASIGWVITLGAAVSDAKDYFIVSASIFIASLGMILLLAMGETVRKILGKTGLIVMAKLTALILSALAAQVIFTGIKAFIKYQ